MLLLASMIKAWAQLATLAVESAKIHRSPKWTFREMACTTKLVYGTREHELGYFGALLSQACKAKYYFHPPSLCTLGGSTGVAMLRVQVLRLRNWSSEETNSYPAIFPDQFL